MFSRALPLIIHALIIYSIVTIALETVPAYSAYQSFFRVSEIVVVAIFTVEYFVRWYLSENRRKYPFGAMAIIDLLAILPFYIEMGVDLRSIRAFRLLRLFRLLKLARYNKAMQVLAEALRRSAPELTVYGMLMVIVLIVASMGMYYAEHNVQPEVYTSIPATLWWAIVTLTTVGYGDAYPVTVLGKAIAAVVMLVGIALIAVPTGVLSSQMTEISREARESKQSEPE